MATLSGYCGAAQLECAASEFNGSAAAALGF